MHPRKDLFRCAVRLTRLASIAPAGGIARAARRARSIKMRALVVRLGLIAPLTLGLAAGVRTVYGATRARPSLAARAVLSSGGVGGPLGGGARTGASAPSKQAPSPTRGFAPAVSSSRSLRATIFREDLNVLQDHAALVRGVIHPGLPGATVALQVRRVRGWQTVAGVLTGAGGRFNLRYVPHSVASEPARLTVTGNAVSGGPFIAGPCGAPLCVPTPATRPPVVRAIRTLGRLNVYRVAEASWYGGGGGLACGGVLTSSTMGVANKTLPCGTLVTLRYGARTVRVPVIDRGPFVPGREFDLTEATKNALGFPDLGPVWSTS